MNQNTTGTPHINGSQYMMMSQQPRWTRIVICQASPVIPNRAMDSITDAAEFFLSIEIGISHAGRPTVAVARRSGKVVATDSYPTPKIPARGLLYLLCVPWVHLRFVRIALRSLDKWPETRDACFVGRTWVCAIAGILARRLGKVRRVIYWAGDYYPIYGRLRDRLFNSVFVMAERWVLRHADEVWYVTERMYDVHASRRGRRLTMVPERIVPWLFDAHSEVHHLWKPEDIHHFVYFGSVSRSMGFDVILPAIVSLRLRWGDIRLDVLGAGPNLSALKEETVRLGLQDCVTFHGFVESEEAICRIIGQAAAGFSLYDPAMTRHSSYTQASRVYRYVGCGTPVIINTASGSYDYVMDGKAGVSAEYTVDSVIRSMETMCSGVEAHLRCRQAARILANGLDKDAQRLQKALTGFELSSSCLLQSSNPC